MIVNCKYCGCDIKTFPSKAWRTNYCSDDCRISAKKSSVDERKRNCSVCKKDFFPRAYQIKTGNGKFCSVKCRNEALIPKLHSKESKSKSKQTYMKNMEAGLIVHKSGADHHRWKGGQSECVKRRIQDGRARESVKKYRNKNPHKPKEWSTTRLSRKTGRLSNGTVFRKGESQGWICVYCKCDISNKYHVDHIIPLSKGGKHNPDNIQLTCPSCNVRKSNKLDYCV